VRGGIRRGRTESSNLFTLSALTPGGVPGEARPGGKLRRSENPLSTGKHPPTLRPAPRFHIDNPADRGQTQRCGAKPL
jgi:hypothetical protein